MWVYCSHDKDSTDQHSLWEDASGNIWSMETIETTRIKFTRYQDHTAPMPLGAGTLHHYQNATHTADIDYDETVYAEGQTEVTVTGDGVNSQMVGIVAQESSVVTVEADVDAQYFGILAQDDATVTVGESVNAQDIGVMPGLGRCSAMKTSELMMMATQGLL